MKFWSRQTAGPCADGSGHAVDERYGLKTWIEPAHPIVDIVFVHGLGGHRERTWAVKGGCGPWPETLLAPKLPRARISTYGYDAKIFRVSRSSIGDQAYGLLIELATRIQADHRVDCPIIFVAHSLGGILCQDALIASRASAEQHLRSIYRLTRGICFIGTPHQGSELASSMSWLVKRMAYARQTNARISKVLRKDSEVLARIQHDFHSMLRARNLEGYPQIDISCFYEELSMPIFGQVVPKRSAVIPSYPYAGIHSSHKGMVKFSTAQDPGFISISNELARWVNSIQSEKIGPQLGAVPNAPVARAEVQGKTYGGNITIKGDVFQSSVVNGCQTINGDLVIG